MKPATLCVFIQSSTKTRHAPQFSLPFRTFSIFRVARRVAEDVFIFVSCAWVIASLDISSSLVCDNQFLLADLGIIFPIAILLARTGAYEKLTYHIPTGALISMPVVSSILTQGTIQFFCQWGIYIILASQPWYVPITQQDQDADVTPSPDNTSLFLISNFQFIITAFAFSISRPFKKPIYSNFILTGFLIVCIGYSYYIIIRPDSWTTSELGLVEWDNSNNYFKFVIIGMTILNFTVSYLLEKMLIPCISEAWKNRKVRQFREKQQSDANLNQLYKIKVNVL